MIGLLGLCRRALIRQSEVVLLQAEQIEALLRLIREIPVLGRDDRADLGERMHKHLMLLFRILNLRL